MLKEFMETWVKDDTYIFYPEDMKIKPEWMSINRDDIEITFYQEHEASTEWHLKVYGVFNIGVVKNQHGYYFQQLAFD